MKKLLIFSKHVKLRYLKLMLLFFSLSGFYTLIQGQTATLTTDRGTYLPGESVIITGTGWDQNDSVQLSLIHNDPQPVPPHSHPSWFVIPDISGAIQYTWPVTDPESGTSLNLKALGYKLGIPGNDSDETNFVIPAIIGVTVNGNSFCSGQSVSVSYTISPEGSFDPGNVFTAELSDASGSFSSPDIIGTSGSVNSGIIDAIIPLLTASGTHYRIRVLSSGPVITSDPDESDITVFDSPGPPTQVTASPASVCQGVASNLNATSQGNSIRWYIMGTGGTSLGTSASGEDFPVTPTSTTSYFAEALSPDGCSSPSRTMVTVTVNQIPSPPSVGLITQPTCSLATGSVVLNGLPTPGTWTLTRNPGGITTTGTGSSTTISGLAPGTYTYTVTDAAGCTSSPSGNIVINSPPAAPASPSVGLITQPTCSLATGSVVLNGLPTPGTWTLTRNPGGITTTGTGSSTTISGLVPGTYAYTVTNAAGCISSPSGNIVINTPPAVPSSPSLGLITQPTCSLATGSVVLNGLPTPGTWTLTRNPGGITTTGTGSSTTISGLAPGTYTYTVTDAAGCTSSPSGNIVINSPPAAPAAPSVGLITQPTCSLATGSVVLNGLPTPGTWTLTRNPGGITTTGTGSSTTISGLTPGTYTYTVTNAAGCISSPSGNIVINSPPAAPAAPSVGLITQPTCSLATGSVVLNGLPTPGTWTLTRNPGGITTTGTGSSTTISGLTPGTYTYTVTNAAGCISSPSGNIVINSPPAAPAAPSVGLITQPTCSLATGSVVLNGLPTPGTWTLTRNPGGITTTGTGSSTTIAGLAPGTYTYTVTNAAGCISSPSGSIVINSQPATPAAPSVGLITQPTCSLATGSVVLNGLPTPGTWTLTRNPGGITTTGTGSSTTIAGLAPGTYTYTVTNAAGCISSPSGSIVINSQPATPAAPSVGLITQPTCSLATGSVVLNGLPTPGTWTLTRNPGGITTTGTGSSTTIAGLTPGTYTYTVTNAAGCISSPSGNIVINSPPAAPAAPSVGLITQPTCSLATGSVVLNGLPTTGTWTLTRTPGGVTTAGTGSSTTIAGLAPGTYTYTVTNAAGCISSPSGSIVINSQPATPAAPSVGLITQPTCSLATGSVVLNGLPTPGTWTLTRNPGGITTTGTGSSTTIAGLAPGTYTYTVTNAAGCISSPSGSIVINSQPATPAAPSVGLITQPTCSLATGSAVLNGLPATGTWTLTRTPGGITTTGTGTSTTISGLVPGTYTYTVTNTAGCTSSPSGNIVINSPPAAPAAPSVGLITQPTCSLATGSVVLNGLPATGTWTLTRTPGGVTTAGTGTSTTISGLVPGTYTYTVTNAAGCISSPSGSIVINSQPATPAAPSIGTITQPTCSLATGSVILNGLPATGTWTLTRTPGGVTTTGTGTSTTISGLAPGTYTYTVNNAAGCTSSPSGSIIINAQPATPAAPSVGTITQPTCFVASGSVILNGLPATGTWTLTRTPGGVTTTGTGTSSTISGLATGSYTFTVTNTAGCISPPSGSIVINPQPATPAAPSIGTITQPICSLATGSVILNGLPQTGTWILTRNPGGIITSGTGTSSTISGLAPGTYAYLVTNAVGCTSSPSGNIVINAPPETPSAPSIGTITQPTCSLATGSVVLNGLPQTGTWTLTRNPGGITTTGTGTSTTISGLASGTYTYTVINAARCISVPTGNIVINAQPATPAAPSIGTIIQPTCTLATGSVILNGLPATGSWTITRNPGGVTTTGTGTITTVSAMASGTYTFTVTSSTGCTSVSSGNVTINPQPALPVSPVLGNMTQPTCVVATGSVVLNSLPAGSWIVTRSPGNAMISGTGSSITLTNISPGTYTFTVTNASGCTSLPSASVIINAQPTFPQVPVNSVDCTLGFNHAVITVTSPIMTGLEYSLDAGIYRSSPVFTEIANGNHSIAVRNPAGCVTIGPIFEVSCPCLNQPSVLLSSTSGSTCETIPLTIAGNTFGGSGTSVTITEDGSGSVTPGSSTISPFSFTYTPAPADRGRTVIITVTSNNPLGAPCNTAIVTYTLTVNANPAPPSVGTITNPTCTSDTGNIVLNDLPSTGQWTLVRHPGDIITNGTGTTSTVSGLPSGVYTFEVTNVNGCTSEVSSNAVITPPPPIPAAPLIGTITNPTCISSTGSVALSGLPASGTWTLTRSPGGLSRTGNGATYTATTIPAGTYTYTVTNSYGCVSPASASLVIREQPPTPAAPLAGIVTPPTCTSATGSVAMSRLPATGTWTLTRYPGAITTSGNGTNGTVTGIAHGTYNFTVTNEFGCISIPTANVVMPAQPPLPSAPVIGVITQPVYEEPTGSVELSGLPSGSWKLTQLPEPDHLIIDGSGTSYKISGLAGGAYSYTVTNSYGCTSEESVEVLISTLGKPDLLITDPPAVCFPATVDITLPSVTDGSTRGLSYTFWTNAEATQELSNPSAASAGTYYIKGTTVSGYFNIKPVNIKVYQRPVANAGTDQVLVLKSSTNLSAELGEEETGFWSVDQGEGLFADSINPKTAIDNLATGRNVLLWIVTNNVCPADTDKVNILVGDIIVPTLITPNGDTKNEYFVILGLESIGESELVIFDRRGSEVFRNSDYDNKWNGVDYNENPLPNDTYFYSLKTINGRTYSGYIVIRR